MQVTIDETTARMAVRAFRVLAESERREARSRKWQGAAMIESRARKRAAAAKYDQAADAMVAQFSRKALR